MPRPRRVVLALEGLVLLALLVDLFARIPAHRRQGDLAVHLVGVSVLLVLVLALMWWTIRRPVRPPRPRRQHHSPPPKILSDDTRSVLAGAYTVKDGRWTSHLPTERGASYDWSWGRKEPGSRWGRIVSWTEPQSGLKLYTLGAKYYGPTGYAVIGLIAMAGGVTVLAIGLALDDLASIAAMAAFAVVILALGGLTLRCGINLRRYDRRHGYQFLYPSTVRWLQEQLAHGRTLEDVLPKARWRGTVPTWITLAVIGAVMLVSGKVG